MLKRSVLLVLVGLVGIFWCTRDGAPANDNRLLLNRLWVERIPKDERDMVLRLVAIEHEDERAGALVVASNWRMFIELFRFNLEGERLTAEFPQERRKLHAQVRAWRCKGSAPAPFELCLEIKAARRKWKLYSREDWVIRPGDAVIRDTPLSIPRLLSTPLTCPDCVEGVPSSLEVHASTLTDEGEQPAGP